MSTPTRIILSLLTIASGTLIDTLLSPASSLATNGAVVGQLASSDQASLIALYLGHGSSWVHGLIWAITAGIVALIWLVKPNRRG
jgi:hypothetical protein